MTARAEEETLRIEVQTGGNTNSDPDNNMRTY